MPAAVKYSSKGTKLQLSIATVFTDIPCIDSLQLPQVKPSTVDTTALDSGVGNEHKPTGYSDGGMSTGSLFIDPANTVHKALLSLLGAPVISSWKAILPDTGATIWTFSGTLTEFGAVTAKVGEFLKCNFEITLDGIPTYP
jgi:hypothetical protein